MTPKRIVMRALALALLPASAVLAGAGGGETASGTWTVAGETTKLSHARSFREPDPFGRGTNPCVLVSNEPVPDEAVPDDDEGISELLDRMRSGATRALQVCFDAAGTRLRNVNDVFTFHPGVSPGRFGLQGYHELAPRAGANPDRIAGRLTGSGTTMAGDAPWRVEVTIDAPLPAD